MRADRAQRIAYPANSTTVSPSTGKLGTRRVTSISPALPRINCDSSFNQAINRAGLRGLLQWVLRAIETKGMSTQDYSDKSEKLKSHIAFSCRQAVSSDEWRSNFKKILQNAAWFKVELVPEIDCLLAKLTLPQLENLKLACMGSKSLAWVIKMIQAKLDSIKESKDAERVRIEVERENFNILAQFSKFSLLCRNSDKPNTFYKGNLKKINELFESFGTVGREANFELILSKSSTAALLLFSEIRRQSISEDLLFLRNFCKKAIEKLKSSTKIDYSQLADDELIELQQLINDGHLTHHESACKAEIDKRERTEKIDELAAHYKTRLYALLSCPISAIDKKKFLSIGFKFSKSIIPDIFSVASKSISTLTPEAVVRLSKMELKSDDYVGNVLVYAAKQFLKKPDARSLDQKTLLAYLALPASAISANGRQRLVAELEKRATQCINARFADLVAGIESGSFDSLVMAAREFSDKTISSSKLEQGFERENKNGFQGVLENARRKFSQEMQALNGSARLKITRANNFIVELRKIGLHHGYRGEMAKVMADRFSMEIEMANASFEGNLGEISQTNPWEIESIRKAISNHLPASSVWPESEVVQSCLDPRLAQQFLNTFQSDFICEDQFGKVRTPEGEEIPVCAVFVRDQAKPTQAIYGEPVIKSHLSNTLDRAHEFVRKMRDLGCTEEQIMMASRIASQSVGNALTDLVRNENLLPFLDGEIEHVEYNGIGKWLLPFGLSSYQNFSRNENGALIAKVRISDDNISFLQGLSLFPQTPNVAVRTSPEDSSFLVELHFEIDGFGKIEKCSLENWVASRKIIENLTLTH